VASKLGQTLTRRCSLLMISAAFGVRAFARPKLGDAEWMSGFREFIKAFNDFVVALDDGKLDRVKWERMRDTWHKIEVK